MDRSNIKSNIQKVTWFVFGAIISTSLATYFSMWQWHKQLRQQEVAERIQELGEVITSLEFVRDEFETNLELLRSTDGLKPKFEILKVKDHKEQLFKGNPLLEYVHVAFEHARKQGVEELEKMAMPSVTNSVADVEIAKITLAAMDELAKRLDNAQYIIFESASEKRMELAFAKATHNLNVLFELPLTYVKDLRSYLTRFGEINTALAKIEELYREHQPLNPIRLMFVPKPDAIHDLEYWSDRLSAYTAKVDTVDLSNFLKKTDEEMDELTREFEKLKSERIGR